MPPDTHPSTQHPTRREFLLSLAAAVGIFTLGIPRVVQGRSDLVSVELPALSDLPDPLIARVIDAEHPISSAEISQFLPQLIAIPLTLDGIRAANENIRVHECLVEDLGSLFDQANADRTGLFLHSGFRDYETQAIAYSQAANKKVVMKPGTSQHHTGLALDFTSSDIGKLVDIGLDFAGTRAGQWLQDNAWQYGFIRSYTGNHDGILDEPWHYLYTGKALALSFTRLLSGDWYGDAFLLQRAVSLGMKQIVLEVDPG
jgi:LAS superfamily LD-carboxypeptidase LdcB